MQIRKAVAADLADIQAIVQEGRERLVERGIPQWRNNDGPNREVLTKDIQQEEGYVLIVDNHIIGYGTITQGEQAGYEPIIGGQWDFCETDDVSIHRVVVSSTKLVKGAGHFLLQSLVHEAIRLGHQDLRIDTHPLNIPMQSLIIKIGFELKGNIHLPVSNGERLAFQMIEKTTLP